MLLKVANIVFSQNEKLIRKIYFFAFFAFCNYIDEVL
jgi:hypothetical protein